MSMNVNIYESTMRRKQLKSSRKKLILRWLILKNTTIMTTIILPNEINM